VFDLVGQGYGTRVIAAKLGVDLPTVRTFRARIRKKLRMVGLQIGGASAVQNTTINGAADVSFRRRHFHPVVNVGTSQ
jgi:FixJ family two-component response regulator